MGIYAFFMWYAHGPVPMTANDMRILARVRAESSVRDYALTKWED